ncbi:MAG: carboxylating nicotinate-nucleotide diphosphorylase [Polyangiaceae bacterium]|nr:carboxylating nicotinate-nucleotide diphosphorylase [Polyangiaceae bacterium]
MLLPATLDALVDRALAEDLGAGDVTSEATVLPDTRARALALAKSELVTCGGAVFARVFARVDPTTEVELLVEDGSVVPAGTVLWRVRGRARSLLAAERVALNFAQRMSGIATLAHRYVAALPPGARTRIADTRKTTPGLRLLERHAVRTGGAHNHRDNLGSAVLIKDNHLVAAGGVAAAVARARAYAPHTSRIEVEVKTFDELEQARAARADVIMLDNMSDEEVREAVLRVAPDRADGHGPLLEASGGISLERIARLARTGVDVISVGALTHSAPAADISLELELEPDGARA